MKINVPIEENLPGYGYIFDLDFSDYFAEYYSNTFGLTSNLFEHINGKLSQNELRGIINLYNLQDTNYFDFLEKYLNIDSLVKLINFNSGTVAQFNRLYPYRDYPTLKEFLQSYTSIGGMICYDKKGFKLVKHVDNRLVMGSFVINIEDNEDSTEFWYNGECYHKSPTEMGKGVFFFNTEETLHSIEIKNQDLRKVVVANVSINH